MLQRDDAGSHENIRRIEQTLPTTINASDGGPVRRQTPALIYCKRSRSGDPVGRFAELLWQGTSEVNIFPYT